MVVDRRQQVITVRLPLALHRRLKHLAERTGTSINGLAVESIRSLLRMLEDDEDLSVELAEYCSASREA